MKPPVLTDEQVVERKGKYWSIDDDREAQRDADAAYYEPLIEQAKTEVSRDILALLDSIFEQRAFTEYHILFDTFRKAVESKYGGKKMRKKKVRRSNETT